MIDRFSGVDGKERLHAALQKQAMLVGAPEIAPLLAAAAGLKSFAKGQTLITQGAPDNDLFFLLTGKVEVLVNAKWVAFRSAGQHVGEMAAIDPAAKRSATVVAVEETVAAVVSEKQFTEIAQKYPSLWRTIAAEIASRLRERERFFRQPNPKPVVFIGCATEGLKVAQEIQLGLSHDPFEVPIWTDGVFQATKAAIEALEKAVERSDIAVLILTPDDTVDSREKKLLAPRDNVIFELGLFTGAIGRSRTVIVKAQKVDLKIPSDLLGVVPIEYQEGDEKTITTRLAPTCTLIRKLVAERGPK